MTTTAPEPVTTDRSAVHDPNPGWVSNLLEWAQYYWQRVHRDHLATWPPPWGPSALAISALTVFLLIFGGILVPLIQGLPALFVGGAEWVSSTAGADIVLQPVRAYIEAHSAGLPVSADTLWWTWCFAGIYQFLLASIFRAVAARLGWLLFGAVTTAMVYSATAAPSQPVAAGITVLWWVALSLPALRRSWRKRRIIADVPGLLPR